MDRMNSKIDTVKFTMGLLGTTQPLIQYISGALYVGVKWPESEADHSPSSSPIPSLPQYDIMTW
jgi:hypothetical protein